MCGVLGYVGRVPPEDRELAHELMRALAIESEVRGIDASGFAALDSAGDLRWARETGPARELFCSAAYDRLLGEDLTMAIGHTRWATHGAPAVNGNNHPHQAGQWTLVHNGVIPAHRQQAASRQLPLRSQCDSELLARMLAAKGMEKGPRACMALGGSQSVLAIHQGARTLVAWTNGAMPLVVFQPNGWEMVWWASTAVIATEALDGLGMRAQIQAAEVGRVYRAIVGSSGRVRFQPGKKVARSPAHFWQSKA